MHMSAADPDSRFARIDGVRVHHKVAGDGGPPVLLLHHFHGNVWTWRHVLPALGRRRTVAAFDRPGFGLTSRPEPARDGHPYTRQAAARITRGLMDHLDLDGVVLVGSSAGGTVALETYARWPDRIRGLVLVGAAITGDVGPPARLRPLLRRAPARRVGPAVVRRLARGIDRDRVGTAWHDPSRVTDADVAAYRRPMREDGWARALYDLVTVEPPPNLSALLPRMEVPTLVVTGDHDPLVTPAHSRATAARIPTAELVEIASCGHTPQEERPDALTDAIERFLDTRC